MSKVWVIRATGEQYFVAAFKNYVYETKEAAQSAVRGVLHACQFDLTEEEAVSQRKISYAQVDLLKERPSRNCLGGVESGVIRSFRKASSSETGVVDFYDVSLTEEAHLLLGESAAKVTDARMNVSVGLIDFSDADENVVGQLAMKVTYEQV